jgi:hypothetical protein
MLSDPENMPKPSCSQMVDSTHLGYFSSDNPAPSKGFAQRISTDPNHETQHKNFEEFGRHVD